MPAFFGLRFRVWMPSLRMANGLLIEFRINIKYTSILNIGYVQRDIHVLKIQKHIIIFVSRRIIFMFYARD